jgi:hypothetical protein
LPLSHAAPSKDSTYLVLVHSPARQKPQSHRGCEAVVAGEYRHGISSNFNRFRYCCAAGVAVPGIAGGHVAPEVIEEVDLAVSCRPMSQKAFKHATWTLHSFWHAEGSEEFTAITASEPGCAMTAKDPLRKSGGQNTVMHDSSFQ